MFTNFLFCVFSYNRGDALQNLLTSIERFYPEAKVAIFDDGSDHPYVKDILQKASDNGSYVYVTDRSDVSSKHGGLYGMMNKAIAYAKDSLFDYAYFIQDDMQFLWRDEELPDKLANVFKREECLMCNNNFLQKIFSIGIDERLLRVDDGVFGFGDHGVADSGIISLAKARKVGLHFPEKSESGNGKYWYAKGLVLYWLSSPQLAWTPWPATYRGAERQERMVKALLPLSTVAIEELKNNSSYAYLEDYTRTERYIMKPYWYTANPGWFIIFKKYVKYYIHKLFR